MVQSDKPSVASPYGKAGSGKEESAPLLDPGLGVHLRDKWPNECEFLVSCLGLSLGLGSLWRMPYLVQENGGAAFVVSYVIMTATVGKPVYFMEIAMGQFSSLGSTGIWNCLPVGKGIGVCMCYASSLLSLYFVAFMSYMMIYIWTSVEWKVPWAKCSESWGADAHCYTRKRNLLLCKYVPKELSKLYKNTNLSSGKHVYYEDKLIVVPVHVYDNLTNMCTPADHTAAEGFFFQRVLALSKGVGESGNFRVDIAICLGICWIVLYLLAAKSIQLSGKVNTFYFSDLFYLHPQDIVTR
ncbi:sodium- and chloride-dependent glycine transporter 2-like [Ixodes scapularis]|uniref:sodium- and chloride-dependent glycine transporter 2-like n=1 Tax=Ixodes scapularis TaxID=6945 RepID=UPI001A9F2D41|nr:sodium- and chloride-dependent glycine transporter 2-like [Ixodes scapularis]